MKKLITIITGTLVLMACSVGLLAQGVPTVLKYWSTTEGSQNYFYRNVTKTDAYKNVYVAGATMNGSGNYDALISKYDPYGALLWRQQFDNGALDVATALAVDDTGNVYICGLATDTLPKMFVQKYDSYGSLLWTSLYYSPSALYGGAADIALDADNNVYITGGVFYVVNGGNITTLKYNNGGALQWSGDFDYNHLDDGGLKITTDGKYVFVGGEVQNTSSDFRYASLSYDCGTGALTGQSVSSAHSIAQFELVNDLKEDNLKNIYMTGAINSTSTGHDFYTVKFDSLLNQVWEITYNTGTGMTEDVANSLDVDNATGNVVVAGYSEISGHGKDFVVIKYNSSGSVVFNDTYNDTLNGDDEATSVKFDNNGDIVACGYLSTAINNKDYFTKKYSSGGASGVWQVLYDGDKHLNDKATNLAIDEDGNPIITGESEIGNGEYVYTTVKYIQRDIITPTDLHGASPANSFLYYENRGQLVSADSVPVAVPEERFYTNNSSPAMYFTNNSFSMVFAHVDTVVSTPDTLHRVDVTFPGSASVDEAKIYPMEEQPSYLNYFLAQCPDGITEIHGNQRLVIPDLYPNIDLVYYSNNAGFKYYFIIKPGAKPSDIREFYDGASSTSVNTTTGVLTVNTSIGNVSFEKPKAYQLDGSNNVITLTDSIADWDYIGGATYRFNMGAYDLTKVLVIEVEKDVADPNGAATHANMDWSTFYGGNGDDYFNDTKIDLSGNLYIAGYAGNSSFPIYNGYQTSFNGQSDAVALKFDNLGHRLWATFIGGTGGESGTGIAVGPGGIVYLVGWTNSDNNFPTSGGNPGGGAWYQTSSNSPGIGQPDGFIARFNSLGTVSNWRTYYGGSWGDYFGPVKLDYNNPPNIFVGGYTGSTDFPLNYWGSGSPYSQSCAVSGSGTDVDGVLIKFNSSGVQQWAACLGGSSPDYLYDIDIDPSGNLFAVGSAQSSDFPFLNGGGYYDGSLSGTSDAFIAKFSNFGHRDWITAYGGAGSESAASVVCDVAGNFYVSGYTGSNDLVTQPYGSAYYQSTKGSGSTTPDAMILKFSASMGRDWVTYDGGSAADYGGKLNLDNSANLYMSGITYGSFPMPINNPPNTFNQTTALGNEDGFLQVFDMSLHYHWGTYLGGSFDDSPSSLATDNNNHLIVVGSTTSGGNSALNIFPLANDYGVPYFDGVFGGPSTFYHDGTITRFNVSTVFMTDVNDINIENSGLIIYPNPTISLLNIIYTNNNNSNVKFLVYNMIGEAIQTIDMGKKSGTLTNTIDLTNYANGIYFVQVQTDNNTINKKFIKQ